MDNLDIDCATDLLGDNCRNGVETINKTVFLVSPTVLSICERSLAIYGGLERRPDLEASIKKNGITTPMIVSQRTGSYQVISGKCRLEIALKLGFDKVPIEIRDFTTQQAELECLLTENLERKIKTNLQRINEAEAWEDVEASIARLRQRLGAASTHQKLGRASSREQKMLPENSPEASTGETRDIVSSRVGISSFTYRNGKKVASHINHLRCTGQTQQAEVLTNLLNKSVNAAYTLLKHARLDEILDKIATGQAKDINRAITLLESNQSTHAPILLTPGMIVKPPSRHQDLVKSGGRIVKVKESTVDVALRNLRTMGIEIYTYKHSEIPLPQEEEPSADILARIELLSGRSDLNPTHAQMLNILKQPVYLNPEELAVLEFFEQYYAARNPPITRDLPLSSPHPKAEPHAA